MTISLPQLRHAAAALLILGAACSASTNPRPSGRSQSIISTEELQSSTYPNAFEVVQALRPQWLRTRGATSTSQDEYVRVYLDDSLVGAPEQLKSISTRSIASMRFFDGVAATQRWGLNHGQGAIVVSTRETTRKP
jgi:hypothetical protein